MKTINNRRHFRVPFKERILLSFEDKVFSGYCQNLSSSGVYIRCYYLAKVNERGFVWLTLGEGLSAFKVPVVVKRVVANRVNSKLIDGIAVEFDHKNIDVKNGINNFCDDYYYLLNTLSENINNKDFTKKELDVAVETLKLREKNHVQLIKNEVEDILFTIDFQKIHS